MSGQVTEARLYEVLEEAGKALFARKQARRLRLRRQVKHLGSKVRALFNWRTTTLVLGQIAFAFTGDFGKDFAIDAAIAATAQDALDLAVSFGKDVVMAFDLDHVIALMDLQVASLHGSDLDILT